jgi:peptidoglycan hydrolase FlgJ
MIRPADSRQAATPSANVPGRQPEKQPDKLRQATQEFEAVFVEMLLRQMRSANRALGSEETGFARDTYEGWQDEQMARSISQGAGFGLGDALYRQLQQQQTAAAPPVPEKRKE